MASVTINQRFGVNSSMAVKVPCKAASTSNITLSGEQTIDGVSCVADDRVLVTGQTDATENGIYNCDTGAWNRAKDWDGAYDVVTGTIVRVHSGTSNSGYYAVTTTGTITIGTTEVTIASTDAGSVLRDDIINNDVAGVSILIRYGSADYSYLVGGEYSTVDPTVTGSWCMDGTTSFPNKLGVNNTRPSDEPATGARSDDSSYVAGGADVSAILGGYDNVLNVQAGFIASQHSMIYTGGDHASIWGGSLNTINSDCVYSIIAGGTNNTIEDRGRYAVILGGDQNLIETGASDAVAGFRAALIAGSQNTAGGRDAFIACGTGNRIDSTYSAILNGVSCTVNTDADYTLTVGNSHTLGASGSADYSVVFGVSHTVDGARGFCFGDTCTIGVGHTYSSAVGYRTSTPTIGTHVESARQRDNTVGNNQALRWTASNETTDTTTTRLPISGSSNYPVQPADSID